ncbi:SMI1/KNR4 family protein [Pseudoalteromonas haloplanktis]|uniref:SMI1/KNR4 family protein n=1 Tax=Pseudoalteromonas haloplanktis TaxID=228 RepID=A0ABU1B836_PSEHA|nr:SMI1/KNR4 family protein [Pseudoalteromonas haloplanktis]MDQ9090397.1 SMI1/KNR4 family protein [Pseudoalteromonas haloplanktis]
MKNDLQKFLADYFDQPEVIDTKNLSVDVKAAIPEIWAEIFQENDLKIDRTIKLFRKFHINLELTYEYLAEHLESIDLAYYFGDYHLVFGVRSLSGDQVLYYQSKNPKNVEFTECYALLSNDLKEFYTHFNGFNYLVSNSMGLLPIDEHELLDEYDWEILEDNDVDIDLNKFKSIFTNGAGGYICFNRIKGSEDSLIWWSNELPTKNIDFWATIDTWITIGFED